MSQNMQPQTVSMDDLEIVSGGALPQVVIYAGFFFGGFFAGRDAMQLGLEIMEWVRD